MVSKISFFRAVFFLYLAATGATAYAESKFQIDGTLGIAFASNSDYDPAGTGGIALAYSNNSLQYRIGASKLGNFELKEGAGDSQLKIDGVYLQVMKAFRLENFDIEAGGGFYRSTADIILLGRRIDEKTNTSPFAEIRIAKEMQQNITFHAGVTFLNDVSGSDISLTTAGIRYSF